MRVDIRNVESLKSNMRTLIESFCEALLTVSSRKTLISGRMPKRSFRIRASLHAAVKCRSFAA